VHHIQQSEVDSLHRYKINLTNRKQLTNGEKKMLSWRNVSHWIVLIYRLASHYFNYCHITLQICYEHFNFTEESSQQVFNFFSDSKTENSIYKEIFSKDDILNSTDEKTTRCLSGL